jgi:hypothetical protein
VQRKITALSKEVPEMADPAHTEYLTEQITKTVLYAVLAVVGLYFAFRKKKPPE